MARKFKTADYDATLNISIRLGDAVPPNHLARFIVDIIALLDLNAFYARYSSRGAPPYAPEILLGLLLYSYATGIFSSRQIEQATYENLPFRFIAGNRHPDHDTIANFRKVFLTEIETLFVQVLLISYQAGVLKLGNISFDGTKIHADASKSHAVSYKRLLKIEMQLHQEVEQLLELGALSDNGIPLSKEVNISEEIVRRQNRLNDLAKAKLVIEARAQERFETEQAAYQAILTERAEKERVLGRKLPGRKPSPPVECPRDKDQYNFTDPDSRIMKNSNNDGFEQHYNAQVAVDHDSLLIVGYSLSNHPNDQAELKPTLESIPTQKIGKPNAAALDNGYFSELNIELLETCGIDPYIATGRLSHFFSLPEMIATQCGLSPFESESQHIDQTEEQKTEEQKNVDNIKTTTETTSSQEIEATTIGNSSSVEPSELIKMEERSNTKIEDQLSSIDYAQSQNQPSEKLSEERSNDDEPSPKLKMASKLRTEIGQAIYRLRKCTVEPVIGIIKEIIGFRQLDRSGLEATTGEWNLTCLAFNLKRLHKLTEGDLCTSMISPTGC